MLLQTVAMALKTLYQTYFQNFVVFWGCSMPFISYQVSLVVRVAKYLNEGSHHYLEEADV